MEFVISPNGFVVETQKIESVIFFIGPVFQFVCQVGFEISAKQRHSYACRRYFRHFEARLRQKHTHLFFVPTFNRLLCDIWIDIWVFSLSYRHVRNYSVRDQRKQSNVSTLTTTMIGFFDVRRAAHGSDYSKLHVKLSIACRKYHFKASRITHIERLPRILLIGKSYKKICRR